MENLSNETKKRNREIQLRDTAGMRDKLIHEYFSVKLDLVWATVKMNISEPEERETFRKK
jgi:uncharacterized protein with HEPN domain